MTLAPLTDRNITTAATSSAFQAGLIQLYFEIFDREIDKRQLFSMKVTLNQMALAEHRKPEGAFPYRRGQFNPLPSLRAHGVMGDEEPFSKRYRICPCDSLEGETVGKRLALNFSGSR